MAKLIVKDPKTGENRPMTQRSYDLAGKKRGFTVVGHEKEEKSDIQKEMDRLRAEKASKERSEVETKETESVEEEQPATPERKKPGPKPKSKAE